MLDDAIAEATGSAVKKRRPLSGGCVGEVYEAALEDGRRVVVKADSSAKPCLNIEGYMLRYLAEHSALLVPEVYHDAPNLLVMAHVEGSSHFSSSAERHAADLLAELHGIAGQAHGLDRDTLIGGLHQPNPWTDSWIEFFAQHRLLHMGQAAAREGRMGADTLKRLETLCGKLDQFIAEPEHPSLLHGDVWTTNVLADNRHITGFIDPAVYYGHPEIELAFITLFNTFGQTFFARYQEHRANRTGFL